MTTAKNIPSGEPSDREIVITRDFNAPRELVWEAMTNPKHVVNWWGPRGFRSTIETMDFRVGGVWKHVMVGPDGVKYPNESVFQEIVKPERIVYQHGGQREGGPGVSFVSTWTFEALAAGQTRVTMRGVFPSAADRDFVVKEFGAIEGGKQTLMRLGEFLAGQLCPPFVITREFNAPRELVWKAWTEREQMMQWFGPKGCTIPVAKMDFRVGGEFHYCMCMPDGNEMWGKWIFREIVAPEKILLANSFADKDGNLTRPPFPGAWSLQMLTETTFTEREGKTTIRLKWFPLDATAEELKTFDAMRGSFSQGWKGTFDQLAEFLAKVQALNTKPASA
ncbi:MAG TPA: SRPBCC family protein [Verrucomicrobiae bacterium]|nr:SRPBCC family protein [Verrucomicrobiae bacterium]